MFTADVPPRCYALAVVLATAFLATLVLPTPWGRTSSRDEIGDASNLPSGLRSDDPSSASLAVVSSAGAASGMVDVHLGNGCFWERQWAYYVVETDPDGPFRRAPENVTALVGYGGGDAPPDAPVCYATGHDGRDHGALGYAETVRVSLDAGAAEAQLAALARDFFASFTGPAGARTRPDPGDAGPAYRSVFGLPGGASSPLYAVFAEENAFGMDLRVGGACGAGCGAPGENVVYVYDTDVSPFRVAEAYHQFHCDFSHSSGMPYPPSYWRDLYGYMKEAGKVVEMGCPETGPGTLPHPGALCSAQRLSPPTPM